MAAKHDWLHRNHEALFNQGTQTTSYLAIEANKERMGIIGVNATWYDGTFIPKWEAFGGAYNKWLNPATRNQLINVTLRDAQADFETPYRQLYTGLLKVNPNVTDDDLLAMGMPARSLGKRTPTPAPTSHPDYILETGIMRQVGVRFHDHDSKGKGKPRGVSGAVIRWGILDAAPAEGASDLQNSVLDTASPYTITFTESQRGKTVYVCLAWQNSKGEMGPWGKVESAIIP
jgi:hypothetical protein